MDSGAWATFHHQLPVRDESEESGINMLTRQVPQPVPNMRPQLDNFLVMNRHVDVPTSSMNRHVDVQTSSMNRHVDVPTSSMNRHVDVPTSSMNRHVDVPTSSMNRHVDVQTSSMNRHVDVPTSSMNRHVDVQTSSMNRHVDVPTSSMNRHVDVLTSSINPHESRLVFMPQQPVVQTEWNLIEQSSDVKHDSNMVQCPSLYNSVALNMHLSGNVSKLPSQSSGIKTELKDRFCISPYTHLVQNGLLFPNRNQLTFEKNKNSNVLASNCQNSPLYSENTLHTSIKSKDNIYINRGTVPPKSENFQTVWNKPVGTKCLKTEVPFTNEFKTISTVSDKNSKIEDFLKIIKGCKRKSPQKNPKKKKMGPSSNVVVSPLDQGCAITQNVSLRVHLCRDVGALVSVSVSSSSDSPASQQEAGKDPITIFNFGKAVGVIFPLNFQLSPFTVGYQYLKLEQQLCEELASLTFGHPVHTIYNPLVYAFGTHVDFVRKYCRTEKPVLFLGMNPGPWGMSQNGVPFGEITVVKDWLNIQGQVFKPSLEHPQRPVMGLNCHRSEVSGARFWGYFRKLCGTPDNFFQNCFVHNLCPMAFMTESGKNITPPELPAVELKPLNEACDKILIQLMSLFNVKVIIAVGKFVQTRAIKVLKSAGITDVRVETILHPSPCSPAANRGWEAVVARQLEEMGVMTYLNKGVV